MYDLAHTEGWVELSLKLGPDTLLYPGDPAPEIRRVSDLASGDVLTSSELHCNCHVGTHVDAPAHFLADGAWLADLPLVHFMGPAEVIDLSAAGRPIEAADLTGTVIPEHRHILLRTSNSARLTGARFLQDYVYFAPSAVELLLRRKPLSIAIDYYSLDPWDSSDFPSHRRCAAAGLPVFVCVNLAELSSGPGQFIALPPRLGQVEAAPVRALFRPEGHVGHGRD